MSTPPYAVDLQAVLKLSRLSSFTPAASASYSSACPSVRLIAPQQLQELLQPHPHEQLVQAPGTSSCALTPARASTSCSPRLRCSTKDVVVTFIVDPPYTLCSTKRPPDTIWHHRARKTVADLPAAELGRGDMAALHL